MIHKCNIQCLSVDKKISELTGQQDPGKWMPFIFDMDIVDAAKLTSDDLDNPAYDCTTIYCSNGDTFILDTSFEVFSKKFEDFMDWIDDEDSKGDNDLNL